MTSPATFDSLRRQIRDHYLADEAELVRRLVNETNLDEGMRGRARAAAADFVRDARANAERSGLIDKFLQEYGLSTREGVTLMRLAEALLRTPDAATADALIEDKIEAGDWAAHKGKSPFPLVNFSTRALMLTAAWLDDVEAKDPLRRMVGATKDALDRLGEPVIRGAVGQAMRVMGEHFVLGETIDAAMKRSRKYAAKGYSFSFDMLGEAAYTEQDATKYYRDYEKAIDAIAKFCDAENVADNPGISVKLSALHPRYEYGKKERVLKELGARVRTLALKARAANMGFNIDAEEADRLDISLDLIEALMRDPELSGWDGFGVVVQAYQRRASFVLDWLAALARDCKRRIMVRLVKGAYWDAEIKRAQVMGLESYPVFTRKLLTDLSYLACAKKLLEHADVIYPQFATHNALTATLVREVAGNFDKYELQRLHGMGEALHDSLIANGARSRIYAPVGGHRELLPYLVRRLLENGANSSFVNQLIDPDLSVDDVVADPFEEFAALKPVSNPHIPSPRDCLNGERLSALGWDETHPPTAKWMAPEARETLEPIAARPIVCGELRGGIIQPVLNPANHKDAVGSVEPATTKDVNDACAAAADFASEWAQTPAHARAQTLRKAASLLEARGERFMALAVFEAGKSWADAIAEVREAVDFLRYYADRCEHLDGKALGLVACISPWNFPLAIFLGQVSAALAAGNCVVAKPAEQTPLIAFEAVRLLHEAGAPVQALHYLPGDGPNVGAPLVAHQAIAGVVFTGSTEVAQIIRKSLVKAGKHDATLIAETGGINAMIVDSTSLLERAVADTIDSAFQSAGQRCSACRLVCIQEDVADRFEEMLAGAMAELEVGDPSRLATDIGPVIDLEALSKIDAHIDAMERKARMVARAPASLSVLPATFARPTAFALQSIDDLTTEIFGPVLHLVRFKSNELGDVIDRINALGFGLTMGAHSRIDETMHEISRRAHVGNLYINRNQIGAVVGVQPFGGEGLSGTGPKAGGPHYLEALVRRERPRTGERAAIDVGAARQDELSAIARAEKALADWQETPRDRILAAATNIGDLAQEASDAVGLYQDVFKPSVELPGPTGESNSLKLRGRGVALCLAGDDDHATIVAILKALAAGNTVITDCNAAAPIAEIVSSAGAPQGALQVMNAPITTDALNNDRIRLVTFDGGYAARAALEKRLAERPGAILMHVSSLDSPWRYAAERTLTVNTTAAGGDVRLLSLGD